AGMSKELAQAKGTSSEPFVLREKASAESALGRLKLAHASLAEAEDSARRNGRKGFAALTKADERVLQANYGDCAGAQTAAAACLAEVPEGPARVVTAVGLALCGDAVTAQKLIDAEAKEHPLDTRLHSIAIPLVQAVNSLQRKDGASALTALESARRFELG